MTYARARLLLGISGVGSSVLFAAIILALGLPARLLSTSAEQPVPQGVAAVALLLLVGVILLLPFDLMGGARIVRTRPSLPLFFTRWARGVAVQMTLWIATVIVLMLAARQGGFAGALGAFVLLQFLLAALRGPAVRVIGSFSALKVPELLRRAAQRAGIDPNTLELLETEDEGFVGGWTGISPNRLLIPSRWLELPEPALIAALQRRRIIAESGAHLRSVLGAISWNTLGFALVCLVSGADVATAAGMLTMAAGMTLWAFVGVLFLPSPSRGAVFAVDQAAAAEVGVAAVSDAIERLDRWQDDEARRSARVETIFHPVPSRSARLARLDRSKPRSNGLAFVRGWHAHHLARHALWLGWGTLSPISRAVHCNVGRPALWAMLPGD